MDPAALYQQLGELVSTMPDIESEWYSLEARRWVGRAAALVEASGQSADAASFNVASNNLGTVAHSPNVQAITAIVYRALARAELAAPASAQGAFIPVGEPFTAISAVSKVLGQAVSRALIVDPYADANLLWDFAGLAPEGVQIMVLADKADHKPALKAAAERWVQQFGQRRPMHVRLASSKTLHDRLIVVDDREAWTVGQSFNALAKRAPTSLVRADPETAKMKIQAYNSMWAAAEKMIG
jgi:hypothetical protein